MDTTSNSAAAVGVLTGIFMVYAIFVIGLIVLLIWFYWRIFTKAGYNGAMSLLNLIPGVGHLICVLILAFGRWPIEDALAAAGGGFAPAPNVPPPSVPPPGSTLASP